MLALATLHGLLLRILSPPNFHTVVLHTPAGELISAASDPPRPKDEIHIVVGLSGEVWKETKEAGFGMVDSELGRIIVFPVMETSEDSMESQGEIRSPIMLLALNATDTVEWEELHNKGTVLAAHLAKQLGKFGPLLTSPPTPTSSLKSNKAPLSAIRS
ncbi:hypothetical protein K443DRAFT_673603 [Laccaria amethystina LaAM-08-1]|uniref:Uncharacterized protein n=1 Tax=Laccaria amethystina LaAM-08-1 TaxID=1095629 RepID=A0A0C9XQL3_9AGAR|nr:hypothetical protein K443DRAFT_673603 [Laccaria amethystina LaAM-08-1]